MTHSIAPSFMFFLHALALVNVMNLADCSLGAFAILNTARLLGYIPQIMRVHRDKAGARAVSISTWLLFTAANIATVSYSITVTHDLLAVAIFSANTVGCVAILVLTAWKRSRDQSRHTQNQNEPRNRAGDRTSGAHTYSKEI
ncbi:hypothetical protein N2603_11775 [Bradyrhizobium huanghuaihaiense]|uniref:hypothetical protein n=1 Tax=Bradyrhizobium huanghuaihaiense TaxID=990078 RepID=UPI0021AAB59A|nr:hypothetical protein [Bradyrhizobium sp. CB3035]UWU79102.1 hypothetical protein N2603_11775 [Bradyrhizobium sp. CB3035]